MPTMHSYDYAIVRVVPRVERGEFINAGIILSCTGADLLAVRTALDEAALLALAPEVDLPTIRDALAALQASCSAFSDNPALARMTPRERFHWLVAPRSTSIQMSPVHSGRCSDAQRTLETLLDTMVRRGGAGRAACAW